jgi:hypothetical protein
VSVLEVVVLVVSSTVVAAANEQSDLGESCNRRATLGAYLCNQESVPYPWHLKLYLFLFCGGAVACSG